jgi:hypothetical protein
MYFFVFYSNFVVVSVRFDLYFNSILIFIPYYTEFVYRIREYEKIYTVFFQVPDCTSTSLYGQPPSCSTHFPKTSYNFFTLLRVFYYKEKCPIFYYLGNSSIEVTNCSVQPFSFINLSSKQSASIIYQ